MATEVERTTANLVEVLKLLSEMAEANIRRSEEIRYRIDHRLAALDAGSEVPGIVEAEPRPMITELLTENITALHEVGSMLRRAEAATLRAHGYTMDRIAELFGVSRQRISALLREGADS